LEGLGDVLRKIETTFVNNKPTPSPASINVKDSPDPIITVK